MSLTLIRSHPLFDGEGEGGWLVSGSGRGLYVSGKLSTYPSPKPTIVYPPLNNSLQSHSSSKMQERTVFFWGGSSGVGERGSIEPPKGKQLTSKTF